LLVQEAQVAALDRVPITWAFDLKLLQFFLGLAEGGKTRNGRGCQALSIGEV
jgi:hypothetical protein